MPLETSLAIELHTLVYLCVSTLAKCNGDGLYMWYNADVTQGSKIHNDVSTLLHKEGMAMGKWMLTGHSSTAKGLAADLEVVGSGLIDCRSTFEPYSILCVNTLFLISIAIYSVCTHLHKWCMCVIACT